MPSDDFQGIDLGLVPPADPAQDPALAHGLYIVGDARGGSGILPLGPGWFDSSFELERGLEVREGSLGDAAFDAWRARFARQRTSG